MTSGRNLAKQWREARWPAQGLHLDSAACSRQSLAAIAAADQHARLESEIGGYVAEDLAGPRLAACRSAVAVLTGMSANDVVFTTGSVAALDTLLRMWRGERTVACTPGEYGPNLAIFAVHGFRCEAMPTDDLGRVDPAATAARMRSSPPAMVHLTALASHRGVAQPVADIAAMCRDLGVPLVVDAAQALGHLDCAVDADAVYSSSRKWLAGPRGVGVLSIHPRMAERLRAPDRALDGEANIAARVGFSAAMTQYTRLGPKMVRQQLAGLGSATRAALSKVPGWRVVEPIDEPTAITTLEPTGSAAPASLRAYLLSEYGIVTTAAGVERAPGEMRFPVLRISPHVDTTSDDIDILADALRTYSSGFST